MRHLSALLVLVAVPLATPAAVNPCDRPLPPMEQFVFPPPPPVPSAEELAEAESARSNEVAKAEEAAKRAAMLVILAKAAGLDTNTIMDDTPEQARNRAVLFEVAKEQAVSSEALDLTGVGAAAFAAGVAATLALRKKQESTGAGA